MAIIKEFSKKDLDNYFKGVVKGFFYQKSVEKYKNFLPHADGEYPAEIIDKQRPNTQFVKLVKYGKFSSQ